MDIVVIPALSDNYMYLICSDTEAVVVDPADADGVLRVLDQRGLTLKYILITHHHYDHVSGVPALKRRTSAETIGPDDDRIPGLDRPVCEGNTVSFQDGTFTVLQTPGHGDGDISYLLKRPAKPDALFCGDTLFVSGCGRLLEGNAELMWSSLQKLVALPDATEIYCGHEYTEDNLLFALSMEPDNEVYENRLIAIRERLRAGMPTVPSSMGIEKKSNPFLRCESCVQFAELRKKKDRY